VVLQWCYSGVIVVLQWCYNRITVVIQMCYSCLTLGAGCGEGYHCGTQHCNTTITPLLHYCYTIIALLQQHYNTTVTSKCVAWSWLRRRLVLWYTVLQWRNSGNSVVLQLCYNGITVVIQMCYSCLMLGAGCGEGYRCGTQCCRCVTVVLQWCYSGSPIVLQ
jgi:hypothetical protein